MQNISKFFHKNPLILVAFGLLLMFGAIFVTIRLASGPVTELSFASNFKKIDSKGPALVRITTPLPSASSKSPESPARDDIELEFGSRASYEKYVASQKLPSHLRNNIFVDNSLRTGNTNTNKTNFNTSNITTQDSIPSDLKPLTITSTKVVCPDGSTLPGCDYVGGDGLQKAIDEAPIGSETNARRLLLKTGSYTRQIGTYYSVINHDGSLGNRQALYLVGGDEGKAPKYLKIESETVLGAVLDGAKSVGGNGIVATAGHLELQKLKISDIKDLGLSYKECLKSIPNSKNCGYGQGIVAYNSAILKVINNEISGNNNGVNYFDEVQSNITGNKIMGNKDSGIEMYEKSTAEINNNEISGNKYGIESRDNSITKISTNKIMGNKANSISLLDNSNSEISNNVIANSPITLAVSENMTLIAKSNTIVNANTGLTSHSHNTTGSQKITFINNIVMNIKTGTSTWADSGYGYFVGDSIAKQTVNILDFRGNWSWQNEKDFGGFEKVPQWLTPDKLNRVADPMFVDPANGDYRLKPNSPARTAGVGGVEIGAFGGNVAPPASKKKLSLVTLVSLDGSKAYTYECDGMFGTTNLKSCQAPLEYSLTQIRSSAPSGQSYAGISGIVYQDKGKNILLQSLLDKTSTKAWYRRCAFALNSKLNFSSCDDWTEVDTSTLPLTGSKKMIGLEGFIDRPAGKDSYMQSMIDSDATMSYQRNCPVVAGAINFATCNSWSTINLSSIALSGGAKPSFSDLDSWFSDASSYYQSLLSLDGNIAYTRYCPSTSAGVQWSKCQGFEAINLETLSGKGKFAGIDSFTYEISE